MRKPSQPTETTALVPYGKGTALVDRKTLGQQARDLADNALADGTRKLYEICWGKFVSWCDTNGVSPLPAPPGVLIAYVTWLAKGQEGAGKRGRRWNDGHVVSNSYIGSTLAAIKYMHRMHGYPLSEAMRAAMESTDHPDRQAWAEFQRLLKGTRRTLAQMRPIRRVAPITAAQLRDMIEMLRPHVLKEARDAAVLAVGFGACRRRSEVVSLNYETRDPKDTDCRGILTIDETKGVIVKLLVSKTNQTGAEEEYIIPKSHARLLFDTIKAWIDKAGIKAGDPVFPSYKAGARHSLSRMQSGYPGVYWYESKGGKGQWAASVRTGKSKTFLGLFGDDARAAHLAICEKTGAEPSEPFDPAHYLHGRMAASEVASIIKTRYADLLRSRMGRKKLREEDIQAIAAEVAKVSGHSMRVGHITSAAEAGILPHHIMLASGHKTPGMISLYTRVTDKIGKSSLKGLGL